jgi:FkbH-like protein
MDCLPVWDTELKKAVEHAYNTKRLVDIRKALKQIKQLSSSEMGKPITIGILRTFTLETLLDHIRLSLSSILCNPKIILGELENIEQELLDNDSDFLLSEPDLIVILWRLEELHPRLVWEVDLMSVEQRHDACHALIERIQKIILQYPMNNPLFLSTLPMPTHWIGSLHDQHRAYGIAEIITRVNLFLYEQASAKKIKIFDFAHWAMDMGGIARDKKMDLFARQPIASQYALSFADAITRVVRAEIVPQSKVLAVDLDDTLWGGILGEDGIENLKIGNDYPGIIYLRIQQLILALKRRGVLLVLLSKNNLEDVNKIFNHLDEMPLKLSDFSVVKVNWSEKYKNLIEAAKELNLGLDSFVFLDDQSFEQEQMHQFLPEVKVLRSSKDPLELFNALSNSYFFDAFLIEKEDRLRSEDYVKQIERKGLEKSLNREVFLSSLELKAAIRPVTDATIQRVAQMLVKTNQFNLTTKRHSIAKVKKMLDNNENILLTLSLSDKFGDQGIVGLCIALKTNKNKGEMVIDTFLMSCRALGRGAEDALWSALLIYLNKRKCKVLRASYISSKKNIQVSNFFGRLGMNIELSNSKGVQYVMDLPRHADFQKWIDIGFLE